LLIERSVLCFGPPGLANRSLGLGGFYNPNEHSYRTTENLERLLDISFRLD